METPILSYLLSVQQNGHIFPPGEVSKQWLSWNWTPKTRVYGNNYRVVYCCIVAGSLEVKLPTLWTDGKAEVKSQRGEAKKWEDQRRERARRKKMQVREKVGKPRLTVFFQWFVALGGWKVGSLKRRVRSQLARWEMKSCTPLWREAHVQVKMYKAHQRRTTFGSWDVEKVHALVARSGFPSQTCKKKLTKLRCRKSARHCGAKHISKSKCTKHPMYGPLLEVEMFKKCTLLCCEAHFQVHSVKKLWFLSFCWRPDVEKVHTD